MRRTPSPSGCDSEPCRHGGRPRCGRSSQISARHPPPIGPFAFKHQAVFDVALAMEVPSLPTRSLHPNGGVTHVFLALFDRFAASVTDVILTCSWCLEPKMIELARPSAVVRSNRLIDTVIKNRHHILLRPLVTFDSRKFTKRDGPKSRSLRSC